jgi:hypothetical protein
LEWEGVEREGSREGGGGGGGGRGGIGGVRIRVNGEGVGGGKVEPFFSNRSKIHLSSLKFASPY